MTEWALPLFDMMRLQELQPNVVTYNALISACTKGRITERALQLFFFVLQLLGLQPNVITYNTFICACGSR